jgi:hypothetical protein
MIDMSNFCPNMQLPQKYIDVLIEIASQNNLTAEELSRNILANHIRQNYRNMLTEQ